MRHGSGGAGEDGGEGGLAPDMTAPVSAEPMPPSPPPPAPAPASPTSTLNWPVTMTSGTEQINWSPRRACGMEPVNTVNEPWIIGPVPPNSAGQACRSVIRAAG